MSQFDLDLFFAFTTVMDDHPLPHLSINLSSYSQMYHLHPLFMLLKILFDPLDALNRSSFPKMGAILDDHRTSVLRKHLLSQWLIQNQSVDMVGMPCLSALLSGNSTQTIPNSSFPNPIIASPFSSQWQMIRMRYKRQLLRDQVDIWQGVKAHEELSKGNLVDVPVAGWQH